MSDATFACPDLTTFCRLDDLGLEVTGQRLEPGRAVLACRVVEVDPDYWCRRCGCEGAPRDSVVRRLAHEPLGWRPTTLEITVRRYRCTGCGHVWRQDTTRAAAPRAKLSRRGLRWALEGIVCQHLTVARVAEGLGVAWNTANDAVLAEGQRVLIADPDRFDGVKVLGVDEHVWRHTRRGDKYVCESRGGWSGTGCRRIGLALCLGVTQSTCGPRENDNPIWPNFDALIWPHPLRVGSWLPASLSSSARVVRLWRLPSSRGWRAAGRTRCRC